MSDLDRSRPDGLEEVWAAIRELKAAQEELAASQRETDQQRKAASVAAEHRDAEQRERMKEAAAAAERSRTELKEQMAETDRLQRQWQWEWSSPRDYVRPHFVEMFKERGIEIDSSCEGPKQKDWELGLLGWNGEEVVAVLVPDVLLFEFVDELLEILDKFHGRLSRFRGHRLYGAVGYFKAEESVVRYAEEKGLFVIHATEDSARITNPKDFRPRVFGS